MFSKKSKGSATPAQQATPVAKPSPPSLISGDLKIVGDLSSDGEIQVDGMIEGDIRTNSLLVGEGADIKGSIVADSVRVHGRINGQIKARAVLLSKTAHVVGDIMHEDLAIETGAFLEGHCKRIVQPADKAKSDLKSALSGNDNGKKTSDKSA
jgi:cytoskeletal protein CcmA (bactofilin family)